MPSNITRLDLRTVKTERALNIAMFSLLETRSFGKITVRDICEKAVISRAAFYAHFNDKYDLLQYWLVGVKPKNMIQYDTYEEKEQFINEFVHKNEVLIRNLIVGANAETIEVLFNNILSDLDFDMIKDDSEKLNPQHVVLSNFYAGGMISYCNWLAKNKFPPEVMPMNVYLYKIIEGFRTWKSE